MWRTLAAGPLFPGGRGAGPASLADSRLVAEEESGGNYRENDRVAATDDLPGVPAGTPGTVLMVTGLSWIRYRVAFDNGVELNLLDGRHLAPAARKRRH